MSLELWLCLAFVIGLIIGGIGAYLIIRKNSVTGACHIFFEEDVPTLGFDWANGEDILKKNSVYLKIIKHSDEENTQ